jgi:outer membrane biosynthesis protein TonB
LWEGAIRLKLIGVDAVPPPVPAEPIVFDLQQPERPRQVIETPEDAKTVEQQTKANYLSDKNALARNPETDTTKELGESFSRGLIDTHELPAQAGVEGQKLQQPSPTTDAEDKAETGEAEAEPEPREDEMETDAPTIYREYQRRKQEQMKPGARERLPSVTHDNQDSRALDMGGLSFNTYNWDFAPYMLALKHRIQRNIHPPDAFRFLGLISGDTLVRFKIFPNGELRDLQLLGYNGHRSLMVTSLNAIKASAPFPDLPTNFPEPYLEVTGKFLYFVKKMTKKR